MQAFWKSKGKKVHTRGIEVTTYEYDAQRVVVEGCLRDDRFQDSYANTGEKFPSGVIHHMVIRLLVNCPNFMIEDIDVELLSVPRDFCRETADCLAPIKGLTITRGFTAKVKKIAGGNKGCTHLLEILQAMAPAVFQGVAAYRSRAPRHFDPVRAEATLKLLADTCHAWREGGPFVEKLRQMLDGQQIKK